MDKKEVNVEMQQVSAYATKHEMYQEEVALLEETKDSPKAPIADPRED